MSNEASAERLRAALFATGLVLSVLMVARCQAQADQIRMLMRGWLLAAEGVWVPFGNPTSAGGYEPGTITSLVVGLPLFAWMDHRAPVVLILASHVVAYWLLDRVLRDAGRNARLALAVLYWLGPWRIYFSSFLWNPNYFFLSGAVHLWACYRQRERPSLLHSALLVGVTGLSFQLHPSVFVLVISALLLWWRGYWKPHWGGVALGTLVAVGSLLPWALEVWRHPDLLPGDVGFPGRGLLYVFPLLRGVMYWLRYASLWCSSKWMIDFDFAPALGAEADAVLGPVYFTLSRIVGPITLVLPVLAAVWLWRRRRVLQRVAAERRSGRLWLQAYALWSFAAALVTYALAPTTVMMWQGLTSLHAAILPAVLWWSALARTRHAGLARRGLAVWTLLSLVLVVGMAFGSGIYRRGDAPIFVRSPHPMLVDLGLLECCAIVVDPERADGGIERNIEELRRAP